MYQNQSRGRNYNNTKKRGNGSKWLETGYSFDAGEVFTNSVDKLLAKLVNTDEPNELFSILTVPVTVNKSLIFNNPDLKGSINIGRIRKIDLDKKTFNVILFANTDDKEKFVKTVNDVEFAIEPLIRADKDGNVKSITGFKLIRRVYTSGE